MLNSTITEQDENQLSNLKINDIFTKYKELSHISYAFFSNKEYKIYESDNDEWLDCLLPI